MIIIRYQILLSKLGEEIATNKRVVGSVGGLFWSEPYGSGFSYVFGLNHSDPAAHAKHYAH
jgi:hypothetical protein